MAIPIFLAAREIDQLTSSQPNWICGTGIPILDDNEIHTRVIARLECFSTDEQHAAYVFTCNFNHLTDIWRFQSDDYCSSFVA
jgi:hypothetical protein